MSGEIAFLGQPWALPLTLTTSADFIDDSARGTSILTTSTYDEFEIAWRTSFTWPAAPFISGSARAPLPKPFTVDDFQDIIFVYANGDVLVAARQSRHGTLGCQVYSPATGQTVGRRVELNVDTQYCTFRRISDDCVAMLPLGRTETLRILNVRTLLIVAEISLPTERGGVLMGSFPATAMHGARVVIMASEPDTPRKKLVSITLAKGVESAECPEDLESVGLEPASIVNSVSLPGDEEATPYLVQCGAGSTLFACTLIELRGEQETPGNRLGVVDLTRAGYTLIEVPGLEGDDDGGVMNSLSWSASAGALCVQFKRHDRTTNVAGWIRAVAVTPIDWRAAVAHQFMPSSVLAVLRAVAGLRWRGARDEDVAIARSEGSGAPSIDERDLPGGAHERQNDGADGAQSAPLGAPQPGVSSNAGSVTAHNSWDSLPIEVFELVIACIWRAAHSPLVF